MDNAASGELTRLMESQRALSERMARLGAAADEVLQAGAQVLEFAASEESAFFPLLPLLDPAARAELGDEHEQLAEDLQLLAWLVSNTPDSPDVATLADALARRMRAHIERDGRLLAQAARMAGR